MTVSVQNPPIYQNDSDMWSWSKDTVSPEEKKDGHQNDRQLTLLSFYQEILKKGFNVCFGRR